MAEHGDPADAELSGAGLDENSTGSGEEHATSYDDIVEIAGLEHRPRSPVRLSKGVIARADTVAYLVNVTVRPGYNLANADDALNHGHAICDKIAAGQPYGQILEQIGSDFNSNDEFQASYLTTQAVNELCPALIWQLRNSAAHYRPTGRRNCSGRVDQ